MIYELLKKVIVDELGVDEDKFELEAMILKDLKLDSTETVAVALALKKKFNVEILFTKTDISIKDLITNVESKLLAIA